MTERRKTGEKKGRNGGTGMWGWSGTIWLSPGKSHHSRAGGGDFRLGGKIGMNRSRGVGGVWGLTNEQTCPHFYSAVPSSSSGIWTSSIFLAKSSCNLCRVFMVSVSFHKTFYWIIVRSKDSLLFRCSVLPLSIMCYASHFASFMFHSPTSFFFPSVA